MSDIANTQPVCLLSQTARIQSQKRYNDQIRISTSRQGIRHSFLPTMPLTNSEFAPPLFAAVPIVFSLMPSIALFMSACAVLFAACAKTAADSKSESRSGVVPLSANSVLSGGSGASNHGVWKSKRATTRMKSSSEQYTHGRFKK